MIILHVYFRISTICKGTVRHNKWVGKNQIRKRWFVRLTKKISIYSRWRPLPKATTSQNQKTTNRGVPIYSMTCLRAGDLFRRQGKEDQNICWKMVSSKKSREAAPMKFQQHDYLNKICKIPSDMPTWRVEFSQSFTSRRRATGN